MIWKTIKKTKNTIKKQIIELINNNKTIIDVKK